MHQIFGLLYLLFFFGAVLVSLFILFHLSRYALNRRLAFFIMILFVSVTTVLLWANVIIFLQVPLQELLDLSTL
jgi:hypothetical protein